MSFSLRQELTAFPLNPLARSEWPLRGGKREGKGRKGGGIKGR